jgi:hypothetical protein
MTFGLKPTARPNPVQIAIDIQLQQIARRVAGTAHRLRRNATKSRRRQVESIDESVDEPHWIVGADIIVHSLR